MIKSFLLFFFVFTVLILPVGADNINISLNDLDLVGTKKIEVYTASDKFIGEYNTSDIVTLNTSKDYILVFQPSASESLFNQPMHKMVDYAKEYSPTIIIMFAYLCFVSAMLIFVFYAIKRG